MNYPGWQPPEETPEQKMERLVRDCAYAEGRADGMREFYFMQNPTNDPAYIAMITELSEHRRKAQIIHMPPLGPS